MIPKYSIPALFFAASLGVCLFADIPKERISKKSTRPATKTERALRNLSANFALGTSWVSYAQTNLAKVTQTNLTPKLDLSYALDANEWSVEASGYGSLITYSNSSVAGKGLKFFGGDLRLAYRAPLKKTPWTLHFYGGLYYTSTFGSDSLGYGEVAGPEIYPALRYSFADSSSAVAFLKYCPIFSGFALLGLDNSVISGGVSYFLKPVSEGALRGVLLGATLDASRLKLVFQGGSVLATTYTLSIHATF